MANRIKISELIPKDAPLSTTDLFMIAEATTDGFESRSITGAEIITSAQEGRQATLVSGTNIKTVNDTSLLGSGDLEVQPTLVSGTNIKTINGNSLLGSGDLTISGGGGLTIGTTAITSGTVGRVLFEGTGNVLQESANLFWDNTNSRLGINTALPNMALDIRTGNVGIGVTSDAGFKLDVNGTARVSGDVTILNNKLIINNTSNNTAPTMMNFINNGSGSGTGATFQFSYSSSLVLTYGNGFTFTHNGSGTTSKITNQGIFTNGSLNTATNLTFEQSLPATIKSNGQSTDSFTYIGGGSLLFQNYIGSYDTRLAVMKSTGNVIIQNGGTFTDIASARLQVNSTTQGFLPPRMTTTQRNAIASPASGLIVYDTTDNKHYGYNGTAWTAFY